MVLLSLLRAKNYGKLAYAIYERLFNRPLPRWIARQIARSNKREYAKNPADRLILESYDGSNQMVHPDVLFWNEKLWLVCTPYPYGNNRCENPSVFVGEDISSLKPACKNPIDFPSSKAKGSILSDPCFFVRDDNLYICYRERIQKKENVEYLFHIKCSKDGKDWTDKKTIKTTVTADNDALISPAIISYGGVDYLYHVRTIGLGGSIVVSVIDENMEVREVRTSECQSLPDGFVIWHIGLHTEQYKKTANQGRILGLLTVRNGKESRLYKAHLDKPDGDWIIDGQIIVPDEYICECREVYKCSYTPDGRVVLSFFDIKNRLNFVVV